MTNLLAMTTDELAGRWLATLLDATIKGTGLLLAAGGAMVLLRRSSAAVRQLVLLLALGGLLVLRPFPRCCRAGASCPAGRNSTRVARAFRP